MKVGSTVKPLPKSNRTCWQQACQVLVGGVNSPVRSFRAVGGQPFFVERGKGPFLWDVEGNRYLDYVCSWGALILGHRPPAVIQAVKRGLARGISFGTPTPWETALAYAIRRALPHLQQVRFVSSGTEAVMSAIRLARAVTGRQKLLKFDGAYHGHFDPLLTQAGSGLATLGLPFSPGVPRAVTKDTITVPFNDFDAVERAVRRFKDDLACVLVEPVLANMGVILPADGFLAFLRRLTRKVGALLIFDEVITGFRVAWGGAQRYFGIEADLTILGKVIGGGFPIGAYAGPKRWMRHVAPTGPVYQAGTLAGHPIAMAAGLATLEELARPSVFDRLNGTARQLADGLVRKASKAGVSVTVMQLGGLLGLFFTNRPVRNAQDARSSDTQRYARYFQTMRTLGIYLPPSPFEAWFISTAHGSDEVKMTIHAHAQALSANSARTACPSFQAREDDH
jgi:glutamate-1-semialdehyde 2,1-aminomutase